MKNLNLLFLLLFVVSCNFTPKEKIVTPYTDENFESIIDGKPVALFRLMNRNGMLVTITNYGAKVVSVYAPDKNGNFADIILGFKSIAEYQKNDASQGAVVGPFANRIANASFQIDSIVYHLQANKGQACLHSGPNSWYRKVWDASQEQNSITLALESKDGELGFPGNKKVKVVYSLSEDNELQIDYELATDKTCPINLTNHSYFNLRGEGNGDILGHVLVINADRSTPVVEGMVPSGEIADIRGTELDFTSPHPIGERIGSGNPQIRLGSGYDFNYVLNKTNGSAEFAASVLEPESGRFMEVFTTEPGVQFYTGNFLSGAIGKSGKPYTRRTGFCLETQHFPDSPNQPQFPSTLVKPGDIFKSTTIFKFSVKKE